MGPGLFMEFFISNTYLLMYKKHKFWLQNSEKNTLYIICCNILEYVVAKFDINSTFYPLHVNQKYKFIQFT